METPQSAPNTPKGASTGGPADAAAAVDSDLCSALLPVLLHRIRNTTQLVTGVNAVLAYEEGGRLSPARSEDLAQAAREADELGWLLAVLSGGLGADLAGQRREPGGLRLSLELVREALRRAGGSLGLATPAAPELAPGGPCAALCLAICELVWISASAAEAPSLGFERSGDAWLLWMQGAPVGSAPRALESLAGDLVLEPTDQGWALRIPAAWLAPA